MADVYQVIATCNNCGSTETKVLPKGTLFKDTPKEHICSSCGCAALRVSSKAPHTSFQDRIIKKTV